MILHGDFSKKAVTHGAKIDWVPSPMKGVSRRMLERIGDEVARASTIVRYESNSAFSSHVHGGGEEFIVLDGVFQDEHGDYPTGTYIRNPPTSTHTPSSDGGCVIMVKLGQFDPDDRTHVTIDMNKMEALQDPAREGIKIIPLFKDSWETVRLEEWDASQTLSVGAENGAEYFVLEGSFILEGEVFAKHSWLRLPVGQMEEVQVQDTEVKVWLKTGHLPFAKSPDEVSK
ncbi:MAG: cupin domain-containing protein [Sneathiella sp.]|nr:cupin domain-containing protein [Sneathiella sp.]